MDFLRRLIIASTVEGVAIVVTSLLTYKHLNKQSNKKRKHKRTVIDAEFKEI